MASLRQRLGYDIERITVWAKGDAGTKDEYGRPETTWVKSTYSGRWENAVHTIRSKTGDSIASLGNAIIPVLLDLRQPIWIEPGESTDAEPSLLAKEILSFEEITELARPAEEWIYYV